ARDQLLDVAADGRRALLFQQSERRQPIVAGRRDLVRGAAEQYVGDVARAPRLADARDARQDLPRDGRRIGDRVELLQAPVARAALIAGAALAEILDERAVAAARPAGVPFHVAEQRPRALRQLAALLEQLAPPGEVAPRVDQHAFGGQPIASRAAGLL